MDNLPVIAIRFALYADLMVLAGVTAFSFYALTSEERASGVLSLVKPALALSLVGLLLSGLGMHILVSSMTDSTLWAIDSETLREVIGATTIGTAWIVRMAAMTTAVACALVLARSPSAARFGLLASSALAIATLVWTGHAGATEGWTGTAHRFSDIIHMLAASVWIGGIAAFAWLLFQPIARQSEARLRMAHRALEQFSRIGSLAVGLIVASGLFNSLILMGLPDLRQLPASPYALVLSAKLALFGAMLLLAAANRWRLTPAFDAAIGRGDAGHAIRGLRTSLIVEGSAALAILALVAWFGTLEPPGAG